VKPVEHRKYSVLSKILPRRCPKVLGYRIRNKPRKNASGSKPFDVVLIFKILIFQSLYNLSDAQIEFQIRDRMTFMKFRGLNWESTVFR